MVKARASSRRKACCLLLALAATSLREKGTLGKQLPVTKVCKSLGWDTKLVWALKTGLAYFLPLPTGRLLSCHQSLYPRNTCFCSLTDCTVRRYTELAEPALTMTSLVMGLSHSPYCFSTLYIFTKFHKACGELWR